MEGGLLRVDLTTGIIKKERIPHALFERWVGGSGINDWLMWEHFLKHDPMCDPRSPDNVFIFGVGPLAGVGSGIGVIRISQRFLLLTPSLAHASASASLGRD